MNFLESALEIINAISKAAGNLIGNKIETGINELAMKIEKIAISTGLILTGILILSWGVGKLIDSILSNIGIGFILVGITLTIIGFVLKKWKNELNE